MGDYTEVFYYYPQLIGYTRVIFLFISLFFIDSSPMIFLCCYFVSLGLDVVDGPVARAMGQTSHFGAALDMLTDKFTTPALCLALSKKYEAYAAGFTFVLTLDIVSHYFHIQETLLSGRTHHKTIEDDKNVFIKMFYGNKIFFGWTCLGYEGHLLFLYALHFADPKVRLHTILQFCAYFTFPNFVMKIIIHIAQLMSACEGIAKIDYAQKQRFKKALMEMPRLEHGFCVSRKRGIDVKSD